MEHLECSRHSIENSTVDTCCGATANALKNLYSGWAMFFVWFMHVYASIREGDGRVEIVAHQVAGHLVTFLRLVVWLTTDSSSTLPELFQNLNRIT